MHFFSCFLACVADVSKFSFVLVQAIIEFILIFREKLIAYLGCVEALSGGGHGGLRYCGIGLFFIRYFGNFNFNVRYCGII